MIRRYEEVPLNTRFSRVDDVADDKAKEFIKNQLALFNDEPGKAFSSKELNRLAKELEEKKLDYGISEKEGKFWVTCFKKEFVVRYPLTALKAKDVDSVVDEGVKKILLERLKEKGEKDAFRDIENDPVWYNKAKGIKIKSVRLFTGYEGLVPLHKSTQGKTLPGNSSLPGAEPVDYVITRNNHHIAIYRDSNGNLQENTVTLWEALERKRYGIPVVIKNPRSVWDYVLENGEKMQIPDGLMNGLPADNWEYVTSMQQNEMFVFGLDKDTLEIAIRENNYSLISKHLYRVQKMSKKSSGSIELYFRHHLQTSVDDKKSGGEQLSKDLGRIVVVQSLNRMTGLKVKVTNIGKIEIAN